MYIASRNIQDSFNKFTLWKGKGHNMTTVTCASRNEVGTILVRIRTRAFLGLPNPYEA